MIIDAKSIYPFPSVKFVILLIVVGDFASLDQIKLTVVTAWKNKGLRIDWIAV